MQPATNFLLIEGEKIVVHDREVATNFIRRAVRPFRTESGKGKSDDAVKDAIMQEMPLDLYTKWADVKIRLFHNQQGLLTSVMVEGLSCGSIAISDLQ